ncbi:MAG: YaeQ family protein, partial [Phycisphaeraceae bacterium]|nr:YaeQ family protein [Phycisphaeraceae bacterium]
LWQKSLTGEIELWIELGQPDEKRIRERVSHCQQPMPMRQLMPTSLWLAPSYLRVATQRSPATVA